jgi:hypothetical protein
MLEESACLYGHRRRSSRTSLIRPMSPWMPQVRALDSEYIRSFLEAVLRTAGFRASRTVRPSHRHLAAKSLGPGLS